MVGARTAGATGTRDGARGLERGVAGAARPRPDDWRRPWPGWPGTRYEAKAAAEGGRPSYLTFRRT